MLPDKFGWFGTSCANISTPAGVRVINCELNDSISYHVIIWRSYGFLRRTDFQAVTHPGRLEDLHEELRVALGTRSFQQKGSPTQKCHFLPRSELCSLLIRTTIFFIELNWPWNFFGRDSEPVQRECLILPRSDLCSLLIWDYNRLWLIPRSISDRGPPNGSVSFSSTVSTLYVVWDYIL